MREQGDYFTFDQNPISSNQGFSKVVKVTSVAVISNRAFSGGIRARLGNRGYIRDFGKTLIQ